MSLVQNMKVALALTNGGRALNAVWELRIPIEQKSILLYLGSQMDFRGDFTEYRWCPISLICHATCMSRSTVFRALSSLESEGYIVRKHRYRGAEQLASSYALAEKIFSEYAEKLSIPTCQADIPPHVTETPPPCQADIRTPSELPHELPQKIPFTQKPVLTCKQPPITRKPEHQAEARKIIAMVFKPIAAARGAGGFYDRDASYGVADEALARLGIDALRTLKNEALEKNWCGRLMLDPSGILKYLEGKTQEGNGRTSAP